MSEIGGEARLRGAMRGRRQDHLQAGLFGAGLAGCAALLICCAALRPIGVSGWVLPVIGFVLLWLLIRGLMVRHYPLHRVGPANTLTMIRAAMILSLTSPLLSGMAAGWTVAAIASVALALDGIDGWLARRSGLASSFGARSISRSTRFWPGGGAWPRQRRRPASPGARAGKISLCSSLDGLAVADGTAAAALAA